EARHTQKENQTRQRGRALLWWTPHTYSFFQHEEVFSDGYGCKVIESAKGDCGADGGHGAHSHCVGHHVWRHLFDHFPAQWAWLFGAAGSTLFLAAVCRAAVDGALGVAGIYGRYLHPLLRF